MKKSFLTAEYPESAEKRFVLLLRALHAERVSRKDFTTEMHRDVHRAHRDNIRVRKLNSEIRSESTEKNCFIA